MNPSPLNLYLQDPSEHHFLGLCNYLQVADEKIYEENCRNVLYEIWKNFDLLKKQYNGGVYKHISTLFHYLGRLIEAECFLNQYLDIVSKDSDTLSRLQLLSVRRSNINNSLKYLTLMKDLEVSEETLQSAFVLHLMLIGSEDVGNHAHKLFSVATQTKHFYIVFEAALRVNDGYLLCRMLNTPLGKTLLEGASPYHKTAIENLVREALIALLLTRAKG
jgi:hypothetical protein